MRLRAHGMVLLAVLLAGCGTKEPDSQERPAAPSIKDGANLWIQHVDTTWAGQGYCVYDFKFDGGDSVGEGLYDVRIEFDLVGSDGEVVDSGTFEISSIATSNADRFDSDRMELSCFADRMVVRSAVAQTLDGPLDLLKEGRIHVSTHEPMVIEFGMASPGFGQGTSRTGAR